MRPARLHRRGLFLTEAIVAMGVIVILSAVLAAAVNQHRKGSDRLAETRQSIRLAEQTMTALQLGQKPPAATEGTSIEVVGLDAGWVSVRVSVNGRRFELIGRAPAGVQP